MLPFKTLVMAVALSALAGLPAQARTILFVGNSFTFGALSAAQYYKPDTVNDLNGAGADGKTVGGVPAFFKAFTQEAGLDYTVSLETVGGKGMDYHYAEKRGVLDKPWDVVVMHGFSTLDQAHPNDRTLLLSSSKRIAQMFLKENPKSQLWLFATWSRADMTYPDNTPWHGKPIQQMGKDVQAGYEQALKEEPRFAGIVPVGLAWNRAIDTGVADDNPYDDIGASKMDLWAYDHYHASAFGYYLEALMDFGRVTGQDPTVLLGKDRVAEDIGISPAQSKALIQVAHDTLAASK